MLTLKDTHAFLAVNKPLLFKNTMKSKETMETGAPILICATTTQMLLMMQMETSALMLVTVMITALTTINMVNGAQTWEIANAIS